MARVQVLTLPPKTVGETTETPFVLVFDHTDDLPDVDVAQYEAMKQATGATAVWVMDQGTLDVASPLPLTSEQATRLLDRLTSTTPSNPQ